MAHKGTIVIKKIIIIVIAVVALFTHPAVYAWGYVGHMVVANIAYNELNPKARQEVERLIKVFNTFYPKSSSFVSAAIWADWIKQNNLHTFDHWHYINLPYTQSNYLTPQVAEENVVWAIKQSLFVLKNPKSNDLEKALFLHFLIHFVGDIHQPMHCVALYNDKFPTGDKGGNLYTIRSKNGENLHELWDSGLGLFNSYRQPGKIEHFSDIITLHYPPYYFGKAVKNKNIDQWAKEGYQLAIENAYMVPLDGVPSSYYMKHGREIAKERVALAGYRLANLLNNVWY